MNSFFEWLMAGRQTESCRMELPHGRSYVFASPLHNFFMTYNETELDAIEKLYHEVTLILEAKRIISSNDDSDLGSSGL